MRVLLGFTFGVVLMGVLVLYLDREPLVAASPHAASLETPRCAPAKRSPDAPAPPRDRQRASSAPRAPAPSFTARADRSTVEDRDGEPADDVPRARHEERSDREIHSAATRPPIRIRVAAGLGAEVPLGADVPGSGGLAGIRILVEPTERLGVELALMRASGRGYTSRSFQATARWHLLTDRFVRPYLSAGVGWRRFSMPESDALLIPLGLGLDVQRGRWYADGRLTLRATPAEHLDTIGATAYLGFAF